MQVDPPPPQPPQLITLPPPKRPTDLVQSALFLPLSSIDPAVHSGRKIRTIGQILAFQPHTSLLLLSGLPSPPASSSSSSTSCSSTYARTENIQSHPHRRLPTLLVNISTPLLSQSPALYDISNVESTVYSRAPQLPFFASGGVLEGPGESSSNGGSGRFRERLKLDRGEMVLVVGWLEGDGTKLARKVDPGPTYDRPLPLTLDAIYITNTRAPPDGAIYRGSVR